MLWYVGSPSHWSLCFCKPIALPALVPAQDSVATRVEAEQMSRQSVLVLIATLSPHRKPERPPTDQNVKPVQGSLRVPG